MRPGSPATLDELRQSSVFADIPDEHLHWLILTGRTLECDAGEKLAEEGAPALEMFVMIRGAIQFVVYAGGAPVPIDVFRPGVVSGVLPYSRMKVFGGDANVLEASRVFLLHRDHFPEMLRRMPDVGQRLVGIMSDRVRDQTRNQQQREKMMALGRLSAGLAHELNNPAAATRRATAALRERVDRIPDLALRVVRHQISFQELLGAENVRRQAADRGDGESLTALARANREDEIASWLEAHGVRDGFLLAATFNENAMTAACLDEIARSVPAEALPDVLAWIENYVAAHGLLDEILASTTRISDLVGSIKTYSHMDRAIHAQPTEVTQGLESTLIMLGHKIRKKDIQVIREYAPGTPPVLGMPGELNQVWTNLIDNAIDAMSEGGRLRLATRLDLQGVLVEVEDNGAGIPTEIRDRVFEPFFTTKPVGEGTGLGLEIVHRIVTKQHQGSIQVNSQPGRTVFSVWLPVAKPSQGNGPAK